MQKLLIISGPTATGKTSLALQLAKKFDGELISADSRQVYKEMDIGTGKDIRLSTTDYGLQHKIWGYDVVEPNEEWSAAHFVKLATAAIADIQQRDKLPIIVGGTGLYIKSLLTPPETLFIKQNQKLRKQLGQMSVLQLQSQLKQINRKRFKQMNESDQKNPRRLIRAIEVASVIPANAGIYANNLYNLYRFRVKTSDSEVKPGMTNALHIALTVSLDVLDKRIEQRVKARLNQGVEKEVRQLVRKYGWNSALSHTIAYQEWKPYVDGDKTRANVIATWVTHEKQYARRQMTWLRKQTDLHWFDSTGLHYPNAVVRFVQRWYDEVNHE